MLSVSPSIIVLQKGKWKPEERIFCGGADLDGDADVDKYICDSMVSRILATQDDLKPKGNIIFITEIIS